MKESTAHSLRKKVIQKYGSFTLDDCVELWDLYQSMGESFNRAEYSSTDQILGHGLEGHNSCVDMVDALGVIVETRKSVDLEFVVTNFIQQTKLPVQLFHGLGNKEFILSSKLSEYITSGEVILHELFTDSLKRSDYNAIFLTKHFWELLVSRGKIFVFQTDSIICENSESCIEDFLRFDYIGSKWQRERQIGLTIDGGSGGLSIRDWQKSMECLDAFPSRFWKGGEDGFFAFHIELIGGEVGTDEDCGRFSTQEYFTHYSYGAHKASLLPPSQHEKFLKYCPEAEFMFVRKF